MSDPLGSREAKSQGSVGPHRGLDLTGAWASLGPGQCEQHGRCLSLLPQHVLSYTQPPSDGRGCECVLAGGSTRETRQGDMQTSLSCKNQMLLQDGRPHTVSSPWPGPAIQEIRRMSSPQGGGKRAAGTRVGHHSRRPAPPWAPSALFVRPAPPPLPGEPFELRGAGTWAWDSGGGGRGAGGQTLGGSTSSFTAFYFFSCTHCFSLRPFLNILIDFGF